MKIYLSLLFLIFNFSYVSGQGIRGEIVDAGNQPIAYANIYVPALKTGTTSNHLGQFELKLPEGNYEVLFQYLGYKTVSQEFVAGKGFIDVKITMQPQSVKIKEIKVLATGEDPAYYVMRHAIALGPYYKSQVSEYNCKLYLKGSGEFYKIPKYLRKRFEKEGIEQGDSYVLESMNKIHFELPDKLEQEVIAIRSTGDDRNTNPIEMITSSLYDVDGYGIISPVGKNAMSEYKFKLIGVFEDQGKLINQIKVIPKNKKEGVFKGTINIVEDYWNIHSADLDFSMPMMDVTMHQLYGLAGKNTWMPVSFDFSIDLKAIGIGLRYIYIASFSEYSVTKNPNLDHSFLEKINRQELAEAEFLDSIKQAGGQAVDIIKPKTKNQGKINELLNQDNLSNRDMRKLERLMDKEVKRSLPPEPLEIVNPVKVLPGAKKNDSTFWAKLRPIPLTGDEQESFAEKDSIIVAHSTPEYKDSIRDAKRKFKIKDLVIGRKYRYGEDSSRFNSRLSISGIINLEGLTFNTVDGFNYSLPFSYYLSDTTGRRFNARASVSYAFARKAFNSDFSIYYLFNGLKSQWVNLAGGIKTADFKTYNSISPTENDFYTLFFENNFQKFYEKRFINVLWGAEITNGLLIRAGFQYAKRLPLQNHSSYKFINIKDKQYTPNTPDIEGIAPWQLLQSNASSVQLRLTYTPRQHYRIYEGRKYPAYSKYPTFSLFYEKGVEDFIGSNVDFDFISATINQSLSLGVNTLFDYNISGGGFLNTGKLYAQDFKYFNSNNQFVSFSKSANRFYSLSYYESIHDSFFIEGHALFKFSKFLLTRMPLVNRTLIGESLFVNYLTTGSYKNYCELGYSLDDILMIMDIGFVVSFDKMKYKSFSFKLNINLE